MPSLTVSTWIANLPSELISSHQEGPGPNKRQHRNPPTPDPSDSTTMSGSVARDMNRGKRQGRIHTGTVSPTKRPRNFQSEHSFPPSEASSATGSGRFSPTKQFQLYKMQPNGPDFKDLAQLSHKPKALRDLFSKMDNIADGISIISSTEKFNLHAAAEKWVSDFDWTEGREYYYSETRDELGPTPPVDLVIDILDSAITCNSEHEHEASWNQDVHAPILKFAFRESNQRLRDQLIRIKNCVNAAILPEYQSSVPGPSKKVDFCVHICPENDTRSRSLSPAAIAIQRLSSQLPGLMFNFLNVIGLQHQPVAIGIETKKPSEGFEVAKLQMGVWQAAHWAFLRTLIQTQQENEKMRTLRRQVEEHNLATTKEVEVDEQFSQQPESQLFVESLLPAEEIETEPSNNDSQFNLPEFLPGIIINGHEWWLTISTFENSRVQFYEKKALGSTKDTKEIYKLVCALQVLRQWVDESYWPWLKELVLSC